jgi:hypothetical protein
MKKFFLIMVAMLISGSALAQSFAPIFPNSIVSGTVVLSTGNTGTNVAMGTCGANGSVYQAVIVNALSGGVAPSANTLLLEINGAVAGYFTFSSIPFTTSALASMLMPIDNNGNPVMYCPPNGAVTISNATTITAGNIVIYWVRKDF